ncbi:hypothetical protein UFOVP123_53 [uncultured Caudovirales phage]|uniref:Uncharacterized protein n=1 Tax=uncultured Caudovirales phage TaxID=2100421 RepID=A0A6J5LDL8_9CAUD|nr:hypothetical protein UFOVP123_53 [uncultured Caudovirales phage]
MSAAAMTPRKDGDLLLRVLAWPAADDLSPLALASQ